MRIHVLQSLKHTLRHLNIDLLQNFVLVESLTLNGHSFFRIFLLTSLVIMISVYLDNMVRNLLLDNDLPPVRKRKVGIHILSRVFVRLQLDLDNIRDSIGCPLKMTGTSARSFCYVWCLMIEAGKGSNLREHLDVDE